MRRWGLFIALVVLCLGAGVAAGAGPGQVKSREGSLVLEGADAPTANGKKKDALHTLLSRDVQVYIFRHNTRVWPQPQGQFLQGAPRTNRVAGPYLESLIQKYSQKHRVDPSLVRAVMRQESGFNPWAVSPKGAQGLMQLMPGTAALMGVNNAFDPEQNISGGVGYLRFCLDRFQNNVPLAVAAYNAGPERVAKAGSVPAIPETQAFVSNVMGTYTGKPHPVPAPKAATSKAATPRVANPVDSRVLATSHKTAAAKSDDDQVAPRPRAKVIEVRYPKGKRMVAAKPKSAD